MKTRLAATMLAILVLVSACSSDDGSTDESTTPAASASPTSNAQAEADKAQADAEAQAAAKAEADALAAAEEEAKTAEKAASGALGEEPGWETLTYNEVAERDLAILAKDPDATEGANYIFYGTVSQFDAATGPCTFRSNIATAPQENTWDYSLNSVVTVAGEGDCPMLANVVQDDVVKMWVTSTGAFTYDTQIGGSTSVPMFVVRKVEVIG